MKMMRKNCVCCPAPPSASLCVALSFCIFSWVLYIFIFSITFITVAKLAELLLQFLTPQVWEPQLGLVLMLTTIQTKQTKNQTIDIYLHSYFWTQRHCVKHSYNVVRKQSIPLPWHWASLLWIAFVLFDEFVVSSRIQGMWSFSDVWWGVFQQKDGIFEPLLIAAGGGGKAYLKAQDNSLDDVPLEQFENSTAVPGVSGRTGAAGEMLKLHKVWIKWLYVQAVLTVRGFLIFWNSTVVVVRSVLLVYKRCLFIWSITR